MPQENSADRTLEVQLDFDVPVDRVWNAFADARQFAKWRSFDEVTLKTIAHDFKPGGHWKYTMPMPNGYDYEASGAFVEIVPLQKLVMTARIEWVTEEAEWIFLFEANGARTHFTFRNIFQTAGYAKKQSDEMAFHRRWESDFNKLRKLISPGVSGSDAMN